MKKLLIIILLLVQQASFAQPKQGQQLIDSLLTVLNSEKENADTNKVKTIIALCKAYSANSEFQKTVDYGKQALLLSDKLNYKRGQSNSYHTMGMAYSNLGEYPAALKSYTVALKLREELNDIKGIAGTTNNIGLIYMNQGNYPQALNMFFRALKANEQINNKDWIAGNYNNIGIIYIIQEQYPEALKNIRAALKISQELNDRPGQNHPYNNIGNIYYGMGNYKEALKNYKIALEIRKEMGDQYEVGNSLGNVGICYEVLGNFAEAEKSYFECLSIANEIDNKDGKTTVCNNIGNIKVKTKEYALAKLYYDTAAVIAKEIGSLDGIRAYHEGMAGLDSATGNYKSSLYHYKLSVQYRDSLVNDENKKQLVQQQMQYDFDKKEAATQAEQNIKDAVAKKELQKQKLVRNGFIGGFAVVALFAGVFFTQRNKIKKGKKLSDELLLNILPEEVAEELKAKGSADAKQFDLVTVMFTDFKGFTQISEKLTPSELVAEIHTCFKAFDNIISRHNIEKIKTIGDAYMCAGGLPVANATHADDVVKAALEIQSFMQKHLWKRKNENKEPFEIRIGIHTGTVVAGIVGVKKFAYDIWGDTVNIASRMESSGEAGKVNISGSTYELVREQFKCSHRGKIQAKNKGEIDMYFVEEQM